MDEGKKSFEEKSKLDSIIKEAHSSKNTLIAIVVITVFICLSILNNGSSNNTITPLFPTPTPTITPTLIPTPTPISLILYTDTERSYTPGKECLYDWEIERLTKNQSIACVTTGYWRGTGTIASVPIIGKVYGNIKKITVDGKEVTWDSTNEIYTRINLNVPYGLNKYQVEVEDQSGNKVTKNLYMTVEKPIDTINTNNK